MQIEQHVKTLKLSEIEEIVWLKLRTKSDALHHLDASIRPYTPPPAPTTTDSVEDLMLQLSVGQLCPVRVIFYPTNLHRYGPSYGLIFGYRRYQAAKEAKLNTIQAQVIHLSAEEYQDPTIRFMLLLMAFTENAQRAPLSSIEYYEALHKLKEKYEALYPAASKKLKHTAQTRIKSGQFASTKHKRPPSFTKFAKAITGKNEQRIREDIQIADLLTQGVLTDRYDTPITKSALLATHRSKPSQQTTPPIDPSPSSQQHEPPALELPDLNTIQATTRFCLQLRNEFQWTPETIAHALPILTDLMLASQMLTDHLKHHAPPLQKCRITTTSTTTHKA